MTDIEVFERMVGVDIFGTWRCCTEAVPYMSDGGSIITTGWDGALSGYPTFPDQMYAISKGAIISLSRCLAQQLAPRLRVNCIAPGRIENEWTQTQSEEERQQSLATIPMRRLGTPDDILGVALFLASPAASFVTGQVILVNGGGVMR